MSKTKATKTPKPCQCNAVQIDTEDDGTPIFGACEVETYRDFAPGHDAKLKGVLIKLHRAGQGYRVGDTTTSPDVVAKQRGWMHFLEHEPKAKERKPRAPKVEQPTGPQVVKIGRWEYDVISVEPRMEGEARVTYRNKQGEAIEATVKASAIRAK